MDSVDNGVAQFEVVKDTEPKYANNTSLSSRVGKLNPSWNEPFTAEHQMEQFLKALALTGKEFDEELNYLASVVTGEETGGRGDQKRKEVHESGKIIKLEQFCPWKDHLYELEKESGLDSEEKRNRVCFVRRQRGEKVAGGDRTNREWEFRQEERVEERMGGVERPRSKREEWNSGVCFCAQRVVHRRERYI